MIISRPANPQQQQRSLPNSKPTHSKPEPGFDDWVERKLNSKSSSSQPEPEHEEPMKIDKGKEKYYNKRRKRMFGGSDSDDEENKNRDKENEFVELKQEVVELRTLHKKEEELYFYDNFAYPWEKDKHYRMVYQLEKKYFPDQCFDKAFLEPGQSNENVKKSRKKVGKRESVIVKAMDDGDGKNLM
ncbi:hypothetical protein RND71_032591 [Anisodus tanguticus]|uniref:Uncharacterized protein n=1 Tax=Anisodus tanguticus TaxID=243964 RepID=A0AAE1UWQ8_9SOLA|nr:hypothetical protein RND71_032591 [Anisodus tanguticus]